MKLKRELNAKEVQKLEQLQTESDVVTQPSEMPNAAGLTDKKIQVLMLDTILDDEGALRSFTGTVMSAERK